MSYSTEQEEFWAGDFGTQYIDRNRSKALNASNFKLFSEILNHTVGVNTILELGANIGMNISVLNTLRPSAITSAVEINKDAYEELKKHCKGEAYHLSIQEIKVDKFPKFDLVFTKGVLIHINPNDLKKTYETMFNLSSKYICFIEYFNKNPVMINYRKNLNKLFKRDFASEFMDQFPEVELIDYGFKYHRDNCFRQDDITWFLLRK